MATRARRLPPHVYRRRRAVALAVLAALLALVAWAVTSALGGDEPAARDRTAARPAAQQPPPPPPELPRGGRTILPDFRVVAFYGAPQADELGELGIGTPASAGRRLARQARGYARPRRPVLPAMELLATIATAAPGDDGLHRMRQTASTVRRYLRAARAMKALLVLDIQPGRASFMDEVRHLRRWLREPDVGLALDPEWHVGSGQLPGQVIGSVEAADVNAVSAWLARLVARERLPQKLFVVHQFTFDMIANRSALVRRPGLAMVLNADGFGNQAVKKAKYRTFVRDRRFHQGFKLFYREDTDLMTPREVLRLRPQPDLVVYE